MKRMAMLCVMGAALMVSTASAGTNYQLLKKVALPGTGGTGLPASRATATWA